MASITIKDIPEDLHARLAKEAAAIFRSLDQEALARLQRSLEVDDRQNSARVQGWIDEAMASGPEEPFSQKKFVAARRGGLERARARKV